MVQGERARCGPIFCSVARAICYLHQGCSGFVAYVMDTWDKGTATMDDVSLVREYPDVFPEDWLGLPPKS